LRDFERNVKIHVNRIVWAVLYDAVVEKEVAGVL